MSKYLLPASTFTTLSKQLKVNPQHPNWAPIQLYLRKSVKEAAILRFGNEEELNKEKTSREEKRYARNVTKMEDTLATSSSEFRAAMAATAEGGTGGGGIAAAAVAVVSVGSKYSKKRKSTAALFDMIKCIKGSD